MGEDDVDGFGNDEGVLDELPEVVVDIDDAGGFVAVREPHTRR